MCYNEATWSGNSRKVRIIVEKAKSYFIDTGLLAQQQKNTGDPVPQVAGHGIKKPVS